MSIPAAYLGVILIWSTTPLAIQWSGVDGHFLFGVTARLWLAALSCLVLMGLFSIPLPRDRAALRTYTVAGAGIFFALTSVYWSAQFIPSGLISVLYGLTPMVTSLFAARWLQEPAFTPGRVLGMLLGLGGLAVIFAQSLHVQHIALAGLLGVLFSVFAHSVSSVWLKRIAAEVPAMAMTTGGLIVAALLLLAVWLLTDAQVPQPLPPRMGLSILYLSTVGSIAGFVLFYYVLKRMSANRLSLITLVTPVLALWWGHVLNNEVIGVRVWFGTGLILTGLMLHEWGDRLPRVFSPARARQ